MLDRLNYVFEKRKDQLNLQKKIDKNLTEQSQICPKQVLELLFQERKSNRREMISIDFLNPIITYNRIKENMERIDKMYDKMLKFKCK